MKLHNFGIAALLLALLDRAPVAQAQSDTTHFAVIGDFGDGGVYQAAVANLVINTFRPEFIITVGDNNYLALSADSYDIAVGQFYSRYIGNYRGRFGPGAAENRFWPALGNHDWDQNGFQAYLDYFTLPGNERYYDFVQGPVHFFMINSDSHEPDGRSRTSAQAQWLQTALAKSNSPWRFVVFHHAPFSSSDNHGSNPFLQWPFKAWGAHAVLTGHDHTYERLNIGGMPYFVCGFSGHLLYAWAAPLPQTRARFNIDYGAMCVTANSTHVTFESYSIADGMTLIDSFTLTHDKIVPDLIPPAAAWKFLDDGSNQGSAWRQPDFDDSNWASGAAQLGYGDGDETTSVRAGDDPERAFITTYFRKEFEAADRDRMSEIVLSILWDDGALAYINGREVVRINMPAAGRIGFRTRALASIAGKNEHLFHEMRLDPCLLQIGRNVMAVEVHQSGTATSDMSFDLMLTPVYEPMCGADIVNDNEVNLRDLLAALENLGPCTLSIDRCPADIAPRCGDGVIDANDVRAVLQAWGACP